MFPFFIVFGKFYPYQFSAIWLLLTLIFNKFLCFNTIMGILQVTLFMKKDTDKRAGYKDFIEVYCISRESNQRHNFSLYYVLPKDNELYSLTVKNIASFCFNVHSKRGKKTYQNKPVKIINLAWIAKI